MGIGKEQRHKISIMILLTAIVALLQLMGKKLCIGEFSISLILLPVVIGAVRFGPWAGAWLGFVFGTVLMLSGETDLFFSISPFCTIFCTAGRGALAGLVSGLVYSAVNKRKEDFAIILASIVAPVVNTGLFILFSLLFFSEVFQQILGTEHVLLGLINYYVSINFLIELALSMVITPWIIHLIKYLENRSSLSKVPEGENRKKLASRLTIAVVILGVLICTVSSNSGYKNVKKTMEKQYNDTAYLIAETADSYLDEELLRSYQAEIEKIRAGQQTREDIAYLAESDAYSESFKNLKNLCVKMGASEILVCLPDLPSLMAGPSDGEEDKWQPMTCLFHCTSDAEETIPFGRCCSIDRSFAIPAAKALLSGERPDSNLITRDESGDITTAVLGIYDDETGELLSAIFVSVPMGALESAVRRDTTNSIVMLSCIEIIFITLYFYYISYRVIEPVKIISQEVSGFVKNENRSGTSLEEINTRDEIQQLASDIVKMESDIGTYIANITKITAERERIGAELNVAKKIQADMLPSAFPAFPGRTDFDIFASMTPAKEVGGDFYDFFLLDEDHLALVIADVSDKGVPAALFMVVAKTLIKNQASFTRSPKEILEAVNYQLCENNTSRMFVTTWMCIFEISTGKCVATNAGHEYPAIRKANGDFELIKDKHGFVLGGIPITRYTEYEFEVEKGGALFVYTDGVAEATNTEEELFGTDRMLQALNRDSDASPSELIRNTKQEIDLFVGEAPQFDDITMLCVKRT